MCCECLPLGRAPGILSSGMQGCGLWGRAEKKGTSSDTWSFSGCAGRHKDDENHDDDDDDDDDENHDDDDENHDDDDDDHSDGFLSWLAARLEPVVHSAAFIRRHSAAVLASRPQISRPHLTGLFQSTLHEIQTQQPNRPENTLVFFLHFCLASRPSPLYSGRRSCVVQKHDHLAVATGFDTS